MVGLHRHIICEMDRYELMPAPVRLNRAVVGWRADEIRDWVRAGAPHRRHWEWEPALLPTLAQTLKQRHGELAAIQGATKAALQELERVRGQLVGMRG